MWGYLNFPKKPHIILPSNNTATRHATIKSFPLPWRYFLSVTSISSVKIQHHIKHTLYLHTCKKQIRFHQRNYNLDISRLPSLDEIATWACHMQKANQTEHISPPRAFVIFKPFLRWDIVPFYTHDKDQDGHPESKRLRWAPRQTKTKLDIQASNKQGLPGIKRQRWAPRQTKTKTKVY